MPKTTTPAPKKITYFEAVGRRKSAVARVRLYLNPKFHKKPVIDGKIGDFFVNWKKAETYFPSVAYQKLYLEPFLLTESLERFLVLYIVKGGGLVGQLEAIRLASARALEKVNPEYRPVLKSHALLTVDARVRERRKVGMGGKARRKRQSPKR